MNTWFEQGYVPTNSSYGLPASGSTFSSITQPTHRFRMGNYSSNNAILIDSNHRAANIIPASPAPYTFFALLASGGDIISGYRMINSCILQHQDGTSETNQFYGYDWFESSMPGYIAWQAHGRINMANRTFNTLGTGDPKLFESYFRVVNPTSPVTNLLVLWHSSPAANATTCLMAVSASADPLLIVTQPQSVTARAGMTASFSLSVLGAGPFGYQWFKDGAALANGAHIGGATTSSLAVWNVLGGDAGGYSVVVSNALGRVASLAATLTVLDPYISVQPVSQTGNAGEAVTFSVTAAGTALAYQWRKDSVPLAQATDSALRLTNLQSADAGGYSVVVSSQVRQPD